MQIQYSVHNVNQNNNSCGTKTQKNCFDKINSFFPHYVVLCINSFVVFNKLLLLKQQSRYDQIAYKNMHCNVQIPFLVSHKSIESILYQPISCCVKLYSVWDQNSKPVSPLSLLLLILRGFDCKMYTLHAVIVHHTATFLIIQT